MEVSTWNLHPWKMLMQITEEERVRKNQIGSDRGSAICRGCGDSAYWKPFHHIEHFSGVFEIEETQPKPFGHKNYANGSLSVALVCEDCWPIISKEILMLILDEVEERRLKSLRSVRKKRNQDLIFVDDPEDMSRLDSETTRIKDEIAKIREIVNASK